MVVIYGLSALDYYLTPPQLRQLHIPEELAIAPEPAGCGLPARLLRVRANACSAAPHIVGRMLGELKGVHLPVTVMTDDTLGTSTSQLVRRSKLRVNISRGDLVSLGGGLFVTSIERTLLDCALLLSPTKLLLRMYEACGTYAIPPTNARMRYATRELLASGSLTPSYPSGEEPRIFGFYDNNGVRLLPYESDDCGVPWELCFTTSGKATWLWRRPPLTSVERLASYLDQARGHGAQRARALVHNVVDGSASPLESKLVIMLCGSAWIGGEAWPKPWLNRTLTFPPEIHKLAGQRSAIPDSYWLEQGYVLECQGKAFHADAGGFEITTGRRAGLNTMGLVVREVTDVQLRNLDRWDTMLAGFARDFGFSLRKRTPAFLHRRDELHQALFGK